MTSSQLNIFLWGLVACSVAASAQRTNPILFPDANGNFHIRSQPALPPVDKMLEEEFQSRANSLQSIEDFANFFRVELPKVDPFKPNVTISVRFGVSDSLSPTSVVRELPQAVCTPELTTVPLDLPNDSGNSYFPTCVRIERCGGCCLIDHYSCQPTETEIIMVKTVKVEESVMRSRRRRAGNTRKNYMSVPVEKHVSCDCRCRLQRSACNPSTQTYDEHRCACMCNDSAKEEACLGSREHFWDNDSCKCLCRRVKSCSTGQTFNHETCSCR